MKAAQILVLLSQVAVANTSMASCLDPSKPRGETSQTISVSPTIEQPFFYYPSMAFDYVVIADPAKFFDHLKSKAEGHPRWYGDLLALVSRDLPLKQNFDLFQYVFNKDNFVATPIRTLLAELLESGDAAIFASGNGVLKAIELKLYNAEDGFTRTFYADNNLVFFDVGCVVD